MIQQIKKCQHSQQQLQNWYRSDVGQFVSQMETDLLKEILDGCFGYYLLQWGTVLSRNQHRQILQSARVGKKYILHCGNAADIQCLLQSAAIKSNSIDVLILYHALEFEPYPHQILREAERILRAEGKMIIIAFNPYSLTGLWYHLQRLKFFFLKKDGLIPARNEWLGAKRLSDWLKLLGFDVQRPRGCFFLPPLNQQLILKKLSFMEQTGRKFWPFFAGVHLIVATKRVSTLTPVKSIWKIKKSINTVSVGAVESISKKNSGSKLNASE